MAATLLAVPAVSALAVPKKVARPASANAVKGQGQLAGGDGQFGVVYSMKDGFNEEILDGRYTVEPITTAGGFTGPDPGGKLLVLDVAMKNAQPTDHYVRPWDVTAFDQAGTQYPLTVMALASDGTKGTGHTLKPGEGLGQPGLHDPLRLVFALPNQARITKLVMNQPRLNVHEEVFRYYIAGATAAETGKAGDPKNVIAPLPDDVRDPADPSGATALKVGLGGKPGSGVPVPAGPYMVTLDSFGDAPAGAQFNGAPDKGKKFIVATMTMRNAVQDEEDVWAFYGRGTLQLVDADGDTQDCLGVQKASSDEKADTNHKVAPGDQYTVRVFWQVPSDAKLSKLVYAANHGRRWQFDVGP